MFKIQFCRNKPNVKVSNATRSHYLPHQQVRKLLPGYFNRGFSGISNGIFSENYFNNMNGIAATTRLFGENGSRDMFTNLLKTNFLSKTVTLDQNQLADTKTHTQNSLLSGQSSHSTPAAAKSRTESTPAGLSVAALNINLSSLGPLYSNAGSISRDTNSSNRVSRAASPSLGNSAENNRFKLDKN